MKINTPPPWKKEWGIQKGNTFLTEWKGSLGQMRKTISQMLYFEVPLGINERLRGQK